MDGIAWCPDPTKKSELHHPSPLQGRPPPSACPLASLLPLPPSPASSSPRTQPTFQQPFIWREVLDISFPRVNLGQHYRVCKLWKQSPLVPFPAPAPPCDVQLCEGKERAIWNITSLPFPCEPNILLVLPPPPRVNQCRLHIPVLCCDVRPGPSLTPGWAIPIPLDVLASAMEDGAGVPGHGEGD